MSRCFPFPPPGYSISKSLIESIKLQRETDKAKAERKRRREKKEKRREKKENDKLSNADIDEKKGRDNDGGTKKRKRDEEKSRKGGEKRKRLEGDAPKEHSLKKNHVEEKPKLDEHKDRGVITKQLLARSDLTQEHRKLDKHKDGGVITKELLERSDLTQEHEEPLCSQDTYCLSDSSENSKQERRRLQQQQAATLLENTFNEGNQLIRLRLPSLKNIQPAVAEQPCSTSGRADPETGNGHKLIPQNKAPTSSFTALGTKGIVDSDLDLKPTAHVPTSSSTSSSDKKMKKVELAYKALVENLGAPLSMKMTDRDDLDWILKRSERCNKPTANIINIGVEERSSNNMWPKADYLAEADVYLMPYTIPF